MSSCNRFGKCPLCKWKCQRVDCNSLSTVFCTSRRKGNLSKSKFNFCFFGPSQYSQTNIVASFVDQQIKLQIIDDWLIEVVHLWAAGYNARWQYNFAFEAALVGLQKPPDGNLWPTGNSRQVVGTDPQLTRSFAGKGKYAECRLRGQETPQGLRGSSLLSS